FDPTEDYLKPSMQGHRLVKRQYMPIEPTLGRLPSAKLGLHLERDGFELRLYDPETGRRLPTPRECAREAEVARRLAENEKRVDEEDRRQAEEATRLAEEKRQLAEEATRLAEAGKRFAENSQRLAEAENTRLRQELEALRRRTTE